MFGMRACMHAHVVVIDFIVKDIHVCLYNGGRKSRKGRNLSCRREKWDEESEI